MSIERTPYIDDILAQGAALRTVLSSLEKLSLPGAAKPASGAFDRIVVTGMGASLYGFYPAYLELAKLPLPVLWLETAELLFDLPGQVGAKTLLVVVSQSGESAEIVALLDELKAAGKKPYTIGLVNNEASTLAKGVDFCMPLLAGPENAVSTKTYVNTLAAAGVLARLLKGESPLAFIADLRRGADLLDLFLSDWERKVVELGHRIGLPKTLYYVGRGSSYAAVMNGGLISKESTKYAPQSASSAHFRHGPFELVDGNLTALIFAGRGREKDLNFRLAEDVVRYGGRALLVTDAPSALIPRVALPECPDAVLPVLEIAAVQLLTLSLARLNGFQPGVFRNSGKITKTL